MNRSVLITAALAGALLIPATAQATTLDADCEGWAALVAKTKPVVYEVAINGDEVASGKAKGTVSGTQEIPGTFTVSLRTGSFGSPDVLGAGRSLSVQVANCPGPTPAPEPQPPAPVPPVTPPPVSPHPVTPPPPVITNITCADLRRVGAGKRWLVKFGCTIPRPVITCAGLISIGAGPKWYTARGWYPRCEQPRRVPNPTPRVAG